MTVMDQQLHGYRQGHQLLSTTVKLPKTDQEIVDRQSDAAGPLRPGERFEPYLTGYPLPSGSHYVLARTWQDFDAPRAGCVRTRSLLIPMSDWVVGVDVVGLVQRVSNFGPSAPAERVEAAQRPHSLPKVEVAQGVELVEALFLEDRKPIVVFDAPNPEGITLRLLVAFWPSFRRTFSVTTFAQSPRTLCGRSFDLVFAPKIARSRFSDWPGRRIDATRPAGSRHRWTQEIVDRVFGSDRPSLLGEDALDELSSDSGGPEAELRISLLWHELYQKLEASPNAVLGLLDIANSRSTRNINAIKRLGPDLASAAQRAATSLPPTEAWRFLLALTDKLLDIRLQLSVAKAIRSAAIRLAATSPSDALANVKVLATGRGHELLLGAVGEGVAQCFDAERAGEMVALDSANLLQLLLQSSALAGVSLPHYPQISQHLATALADASAETRCSAKRHLLHVLVEDPQADAAAILIADLDREELLAETKWLHRTNAFAAKRLHAPLVARAQELDAVDRVRDVVAELPTSLGTDSLLLLLLLVPARIDFQWLLLTPKLDDDRRLDMLRQLLGSASDLQFKSMVAGRHFKAVLQHLLRDEASSFDILWRVLGDARIDASIAVDTTMRLLPYATNDGARLLAERGLQIILPRNAGSNRDSALDQFLGIVGSDLDGSRAMRLGLNRDVPGEVFAANLSAFNRSPPLVRGCIMSAIKILAKAIVARGRIDYSEFAVADAATLLWDSALQDQRAFVDASAILMPFLLKSQREPASPLIAVAFPAVYLELKHRNDAPDIFKYFVFMDWDKCKTASHELVDAFMQSNWRAIDIALAAARAGDLARIFRRISKQDGGEQVIADIERNSSGIPEPWRSQVRQALKRVPYDT